MNKEEECQWCHGMTPSEELVETTPEDTQGYFPNGIKVCPRCLANIQYEAFQAFLWQLITPTILLAHPPALAH